MPHPLSKAIAFPAGGIAGTGSGDPVIEALVKLRREIADSWLKMPADAVEKHYAGRIGKTHKMVCHSNLQLHPASPSDREFARALCAQLATTGTPPVGTLLAAMLYIAPHEFPRIAEIPGVPPWFRADYVNQMMVPPPLFRHPGEAAAYRDFMLRWVSHIRDVVAADPRSETGTGLAQSFGAASYFHSVYFNATNVREIFRRRAEILEISLEAINYELDWQFPPRQPRARLRVGVFALDFLPRTETFATLPVFRDLDRSRFEVVLFAPRFEDSPMEKLCVQHADRFIRLPADLQAQVRTMREADLDLLFIGTNVTAAGTDAAALMLHRLARVQTAGICCCVTTGMRNVDCFLSGTLSEPADGQSHYTEKLYLMDGPAHCFDFGDNAPTGAAPPLRREDFGIPRKAVVFASGANFHKILPELEEVWLRILASVPDSRLLLYPFNPNWDSYSIDAFMTRLAAGLQRHGIEPQRVLVLEAAPQWNDVLRRLSLADIYLDSFPFCGATSLLDPLFCGLPVIGMEGTAHRALQGPGVLRSLGLGELVAADVNAYIRLAIRLAVNHKHCKALATRVKSLMQQQPVILDRRRYAAAVGRAFEQMWQDHCDGRLSNQTHNTADKAQ